MANILYPVINQSGSLLGRLPFAGRASTNQMATAKEYVLGSSTEKKYLVYDTKKERKIHDKFQ